MLLKLEVCSGLVAHRDTLCSAELVEFWKIKTMATAKPDIGELPDEVLLKILSFLPPVPSLITCSSVNKQWSRLAFDPSLWRVFAVPSSYPITDEVLARLGPRVGEFLREIDLSNCDNITEVGAVRFLRFCHHANALKFPKHISLGCLFSTSPHPR